MIYNEPFVAAVQQEQRRRGDTQVVFAYYLDTDQGALSKFYRRGVKDNLVIKILRKYPHFAIFFRSEDYVNEPPVF